MDNFNALSKSAILTKLALDGYFIDLLTLNSFIKEWQIEAIYENEFGIEFFDNNSYLTILDKLKEQYNKAKKVIIDKPSENAEQKTNDDVKTDEVSDEKKEEDNIPPDSKISMQENIEPIAAQAPLNEQKDTKDDYAAVSLEDLAQASREDFQTENSTEFNNLKPDENTLADESVIDDRIMPAAMRNLKPGPVCPNSNITVDHSYTPSDVVNRSASSVIENNSDTKEDDNSLDNLIEGENFTDDEIEKADELIKSNSKTLPESITETYFDANIENKDAESSNEIKEEISENKETENKETKSDDLDLVQLAQSFAQNFTGKDEGDVPPADLEHIFTESYTDSFSELQDYVKDEPEEYESLQEDLPSDIITPPEPPKEATHFDSALSSKTSNLNAEDIRNIIREEISRQTSNVVPIPQNNENVREILREIVKQTADVVPQNAFKLDISQGTLDMIAKTIAKKIAIKLNSYYKLNSSKQNAKLQLFRERTIELKEKNQMLAEENKKLKARLLETNRELESYKPTIFGLFKFTGRKRR